VDPAYFDIGSLMSFDDGLDAADAWKSKSAGTDESSLKSFRARNFCFRLRY
jgi:hypothetical protein